MPKRKSPPAGEESTGEPARRRSSRLQKSANASPPTAPSKAAQNKPKVSSTKPTAAKDTEKEQLSSAEPKTLDRKAQSQKRQATAEKRSTASKANGETAVTSGKAVVPEEESNYWLLKAEPESRFENGVDVKFSIDDLKAKTEPEPWDGIRSYAARNNLRAMKKGQLAFFYHSNCKEPGIYGTMEIVQEHSPDLSAHDPKAPYYDSKSDPSDPKWSVVHVKFRSKFAVPILLKELREMGAPGKPLEHMQLLKQSRLSVTKVSPAEWKYLLEVAEQKAS
ncbi:hypothetical protein C7999DRAFT_34676 [Corynascus novoguineensis]|uniref:Thymocyte nuclear protein 1 n=1 Tax=Corynascus novoguineensis TaxID=1126955 RepID=A0AAN7CMM3_9PEZI|nr:hypothetical protein C7999DRAFT_34676 [Corynascus novoguineensis]